jgi:hypothetical protein
MIPEESHTVSLPMATNDSTSAVTTSVHSGSSSGGDHLRRLHPDLHLPSAIALAWTGSPTKNGGSTIPCESFSVIAIVSQIPADGFVESQHAEVRLSGRSSIMCGL